MDRLFVERSPSIDCRHTSSQRVLIAFLWTCFLAAPFGAPQVFAADVGSVRGVVNDPQGQPIAEATIKLKSKTSDWLQSTTTSRRGEFAFSIVPLGDYVLSINKKDFRL